MDTTETTRPRARKTASGVTKMAARQPAPTKKMVATKVVAKKVTTRKAVAAKKVTTRKAVAAKKVTARKVTAKKVVARKAPARKVAAVTAPGRSRPSVRSVDSDVADDPRALIRAAAARMATESGAAPRTDGRAPTTARRSPPPAPPRVERPALQPRPVAPRTPPPSSHQRPPSSYQPPPPPPPPSPPLASWAPPSGPQYQYQPPPPPGAGTGTRRKSLLIAGAVAAACIAVIVAVALIASSGDDVDSSTVAGPAPEAGAPDEAFRPISGFTFEDAPSGIAREVEDGFERGFRMATGDDPDVGDFLDGIAARTVLEDGDEIAVAVVMSANDDLTRALDDEEALSGFELLGEDAEETTIAGTPAVFFTIAGEEGLASYKNGTFIMLIVESGGRSTMNEIMAGLLDNVT